MTAEELVKAGQLDAALAELQKQVRANAADPKLRVFLFQLLAVRGDWERALTQLNLAADMKPENLLMAQVCRAALQCEALRADIFAGKRMPLVLGEPAEWLGWLIQANQYTAQGQYAAARELREKAFEAAPAVAGRLNGQPFEWIADADQRLGPVLEAIVDGKYYWVPFGNIKQLTIEAPTDLRDVVWTPATFLWANGGSAVGLVPTRYPGSERSADDGLRLARKTEWQEDGGGTVTGLGHRLLATDQSETPLLDVRSIQLDSPAPVEGAQAAEA